jgi:hypothetical protein
MERTLLRSLATVACAALIGAAGGARAVDGVFEVNHTSVLAAGGYPFAIGTSGSYVLTSSLTPPAGVGAIVVAAPDVTLDLNGFSVTGSGIVATGIDAGPNAGLTVRNGIVSGFGDVGIRAGSRSKILQVTVTGIGQTAILATSCLILESIVEDNPGADGVNARDCKIENNVIRENAKGVVSTASVIVHNQIEDNGDLGIMEVGGSTIQENVISNNTSYGIKDGNSGPYPPGPPPPAFERTNVRGNTIHGNGVGIFLARPALISENAVSANTGTGIECVYLCTLQANVIDSNNTFGAAGSGGAIVGDGGSVIGNSISFNSVFGLRLPSTTGYSQNTLNANGAADVVLSPLPGPHPTSGFMNLCSGMPGPAPTCP